jgi:hypothetical protein
MTGVAALVSPATAQEWVARDVYAVPIEPPTVVEEIAPAPRYVERYYTLEAPTVRSYSYYSAVPTDPGTVYVAPRARTTEVVPAMSSQSWIDYCAAKFRTFDPTSGTYLGADGLRHYCR